MSDKGICGRSKYVFVTGYLQGHLAKVSVKNVWRKSGKSQAKGIRGYGVFKKIATVQIGCVMKRADGLRPACIGVV